MTATSLDGVPDLRLVLVASSAALLVGCGSEGSTAAAKASPTAAPSPVVGQEAEFACERGREALAALQETSEPIGERKGDALQLLSQARRAVGQAEGTKRNQSVLFALAGVTRAVSISKDGAPAELEAALADVCPAP